MSTKATKYQQMYRLSSKHRVGEWKMAATGPALNNPFNIVVNFFEHASLVYVGGVSATVANYIFGYATPNPRKQSACRHVSLVSLKD
jgi:hypothetical protein